MNLSSFSPWSSAIANFFESPFFASDSDEEEEKGPLEVFDCAASSLHSLSGSDRAVRLEESLLAAIDRLLADDAEMLKEEGIFRESAKAETIELLKAHLPRKFVHNDLRLKKFETFNGDFTEFYTESPHLLTCFLKASLRQFEFFSRGFVKSDLERLTDQIDEDPEGVIEELKLQFHSCNRCVGAFLHLLKKSAELQSLSVGNKMGSENLSIVLKPLFYSHFSDEELLETSPSLSKFLIECADKIVENNPSLNLASTLGDRGESSSISLIDAEPEIVSLPFESLFSYQQERVAQSINAAIGTLLANDGELLKTENLFFLSARVVEVRELLERLPISFDETDPVAIACFLKSIFYVKIGGNSSKRMEFLPKTFTFSHFPNMVLLGALPRFPIELPRESSK